MILPIVAFGSPILRKRSIDVSSDYPYLADLIANMWETMHAAHGVGLAAPQINRSIRLFVIDTTPFFEDNQEGGSFKQVFINPRIISYTGDKDDFNEGCLSIPGIREDINRNTTIIIEYYDENFEYHKREFDGVNSRVIQHEYDHIEGVLFIDKISHLRKRMIKGKLKDVQLGKIDVSYKMRFYQ
jgi:peptide deformylase